MSKKNQHISKEVLKPLLNKLRYNDSEDADYAAIHMTEREQGVAAIGITYNERRDRANLHVKRGRWTRENGQEVFEVRPGQTRTFTIDDCTNSTTMATFTDRLCGLIIDRSRDENYSDMMMDARSAMQTRRKVGPYARR